MRELSPQDEIGLSRDAEPIVVVPPYVWHCLFCDPGGGDGANTTVQWVGHHDGPDGRCRQCGQKYSLAEESWMKVRAGMPTEMLHGHHCPHCHPDAGSESRPSVTWRNGFGICARCGQGFRWT